MPEKSEFPKVTLKYSALEAFVKVAKKYFDQGIFSLQLKREFNPDQRLLLSFQVKDRQQPIEIISQIIDRVEAPDKKGFTYGMRFLNFTEKKLNKILEGTSIPPETTAPKPKIIPPEKPQEIARESIPSSPAEQEKAEIIEAEIIMPEETIIEQEVVIGTGPRESFDGRPKEKPEKITKLAEPAPSKSPEPKAPPLPEIKPKLETTVPEPRIAQEIKPAEPEAVEPKLIEPEPEEFIPEPEAEPEIKPGLEKAELVPPPVSPESEPQPSLAQEPTPPEQIPSPEWKPISPKDLSDFFFRFCKMVLNPLDPSLPDTTKQFQALFDDFQKMMQNRDRLGIYLALSPSGKDFIIEGAQTLPKSIKIILTPDIVGTLIFRLIQFFDEKGLVGIIFRKFIDFEHFQKFIQELAKFNPEKDSPDELGLRLIQSGIYQFNLILETDLVAVPEKISEETKIILARLSGDLKRLQCLAEQIGEEPLALLTLRLEDVIRLVNNPQVIAQVLEHLPLSWSDKITELEFSDFEEQFIFSIPASILLGCAEILAKKLSGFPAEPESKAKPPNKIRARLEKLLRKVMARIAYETPDQALELLAHLLERKLIRYEELPEELRDPVSSFKLAEDFLKTPEQKLELLKNTNSKTEYRKLASQLLWASVALLEKKQPEWADKIFNTLVSQYQDKNPPFPERPKIAREMLKRLSEPMAVELLVRLLDTGKREVKELCAGMIYAGGDACAEKLLSLLEKSEDRNTRRLTCEVLARFGEKVAPLLVKKLNQPQIPWYFTRNLLMILAEIKSPAIQGLLNQFLTHPHQRVREEALGYLFAISGKNSEEILANALNDSESSVKSRALGYLAKLPQISNSSLSGLVNLIKSLEEEEPDAEKELCFQRALDLLSKSAPETLPDRTKTERFLLEILERSEPKGIFSRAKSNLSPKMKIILIEELGKRKVEEAKKILSKLAKDKDEQVKKSAEKALSQLAEK